MTKYPELSPYQFASNRPIQGIDLDGLEFSEAPSGQLSQMIKIGKTSVVIEAKIEKTIYQAKDLTDRTGWLMEVRNLETNDKRTFHYTEDTKTSTDAKNWKDLTNIVTIKRSIKQQTKLQLEQIMWPQNC